MSKVTILGINGHIGHHAARAFSAAGWEVTGMGRANKQPIPGVRFVTGDAQSVADMRAAIGDSAVVVNALNLPYHQWDKGRMEAMTERVVEAMGKGRTMLFPGNIYNYAQSLRLVTPDQPQEPSSAKGEIRKRTEAILRAAADRGDMQVIILRAGDFFGPGNAFDWFDLVMLREAGKGKLALMGDRGVGHSWAYLPDLARAFEKLAWHRQELGAYENFHFAGNFVTPEVMADAIRQAAPVPLKVSYFPRLLFSLLGVADPMMREVARMSYLWANSMELRDARLDALLGPDFGTPFDQAVASAVQQFFPQMERAA